MLQLGTKAETLKKLYNKLGKAKVLESYSFTVAEWEKEPSDIWDKVRDTTYRSTALF